MTPTTTPDMTTSRADYLNSLEDEARDLISTARAAFEDEAREHRAAVTFHLQGLARAALNIASLIALSPTAFDYAHHQALVLATNRLIQHARAWRGNVGDAPAVRGSREQLLSLARTALDATHNIYLLDHSEPDSVEFDGFDGDTPLMACGNALQRLESLLLEIGCKFNDCTPYRQRCSAA